MAKEAIIEVKDLVQHFRISDSYTVKAVNDISFSIFKNETFGLVGETGCGKSTVARTVSGIYKPTSGDVYYKDIPVSGKKGSREQRRKMQYEVQIVFQDSAAALNPRKRVCQILLEPLKIQKRIESREKADQLIIETLKQVGMDESCLTKVPSELSGGQRQRIAIARSLMLNPALLIADEPVASLDLSIQAQIINLLNQCKQERQLSMLFIAHDLAVVRFISDRIGVMLNGKLVEVAPTEELFANPIHPYTQSLLSAVHLPDPIYERSKKLLDYDHSLPLGDHMKEYRPGHFVLEQD